MKKPPNEMMGDPLFSALLGLGGTLALRAEELKRDSPETEWRHFVARSAVAIGCLVADAALSTGDKYARWIADNAGDWDAAIAGGIGAAEVLKEEGPDGMKKPERYFTALMLQVFEDRYQEARRVQEN